MQQTCDQPDQANGAGASYSAVAVGLPHSKAPAGGLCEYAAANRLNKLLQRLKLELLKDVVENFLVKKS
ncbi:hypothetical protein ACOZB2_27230 [Pantoea endophytica]